MSRLRFLILTFLLIFVLFFYYYYSQGAVLKSERQIEKERDEQQKTYLLQQINISKARVEELDRTYNNYKKTSKDELDKLDKNIVEFEQQLAEVSPAVENNTNIITGKEKLIQEQQESAKILKEALDRCLSTHKEVYELVLKHDKELGGKILSETPI
eukprot:TRINITY_DN7692_c0_g1_i2.p1 TRINITY_DN7692_c0_g1~~TRINITY_DN7692_c0_g1_i2.p1  ORF type:complete len:157 (-),score=22.29 TRINITY_DN7692_c0_g1_i2:56-526(-)